jgi:hypothetical protein
MRKYFVKIVQFLALLCMGALFQSCSEKDSYRVATYYADDKIELGDMTLVHKYFDQMMAHGRVNDKIENFRVWVQAGAANEKIYQLQGLARGGKVIAMEVYKDDNDAIVMKSSSLTQGMVICESDCEAGCTPTISKGTWTCANACEGSSCKKTEVRHYKENNYTTPIQSFMMEDF